MEKKVYGLAKGIIEELIKADLTMHEMQIEEWARIARHRPSGPDIPPDIMKGFGENRYLSLNEVELTLHVKPRPQGFWKRLKLALKLIVGKELTNNSGQHIYDLCQPADEDQSPMKLLIKRLDDGMIKATYQPADITTSTLMNA